MFYLWNFTNILLYVTTYFKLPFVSNEIENQLYDLDKNMLHNIEPEEIIEFQALPLFIKNNELVLLTAYPENKKTLKHFKNRFSIQEVIERVVTDQDISNLVKRLFKKNLQTKTIFGLYNRKPEESASVRVTKPQAAFFWVMFACMAMGLWFYTDQVLPGIFAMIQIFYLLSISYKFIISAAGARHKFFNKKNNEQEKNLKIKEYPVYTILVPLFKEPETILKSIINAIKNLEYPGSKLDVIFLFEKMITRL